MKKLLLISVLSLACVGAFAQGKVTVANDNAHLVMYTTDVFHLPAAYSSLAGQAVAQAGGANPINMGLFTVEFLAGATAENLSVFSSVNAANPGLPDGRFVSTSVTLAGHPGGTPVFAQVRIWEAAAGSWDATQTRAGGAQWLQASSSVFSVTPGGFAPIPIVTTWPVGPLNLGVVDGAAGVVRATLTLTRSGSNVTISWNWPGTLQSTTTPPSGWANVSGVTGNSYTTTASGAAQYYRLQQQ